MGQPGQYRIRWRCRLDPAKVESFAARGNPADTTRTLVAIERARASIKASTPPQLAVESVMVSIKDPKLASVHVNMR